MQKSIKKFIFTILAVAISTLCFVGCGKNEPQIVERNQMQEEIRTQNYKKYVLDKNIELKDGAFISIQEDTLLDLNGYAIIGNNSYAIQVGSAGKKAHLVLQDSKGVNNTHYLAYSKYTNSYSRYAVSQQGGVDATDAPTFLPDSFITVQGGLITGGNGSLSGGGVYLYEGSKMDMLSGTIAGNSSTGCGGGVFVGKSAMFTLRGGTIKGNSSAGYGGAVYAAEGKCNIFGGEIIGNTAVAGGGGVYTISSELNVTGGNIMQNRARFGGGINAIASYVSIFGGNVQGNMAQEGGGMSLFNSNLEFEDGIVRENKASKFGGGIKFAQTEGSATFNLYDGKIEENTAKQGGAIYLIRATVNLNGGMLQKNRGTDGENVIYNLENLGTIHYGNTKIEE